MAGARILAVDDEQLNRVLLESVLEQEGYEVTAVGRGEDALEALTSASYDLVLLDLLLPDMEGEAVLAAMRADAGLADLPVLLISALEESEEIERLLGENVVGFVPKPFDREWLSLAVGDALASGNEA